MGPVTINIKRGIKMEKIKMDKDLAMKIFALHLEENAIEQKKYDLKKELGFMMWQDACTAAMKFMMGEGK